jgi:signal transduction histidine kinase
MRINNKKRAVVFKRVFFLVSVVLAIVALLLFLFDFFGAALISIGVFSLWYLYFHVADYQFIEFRNENNRIVLRYHKAVSLGSPRFNEIEFPQQMLRKAIFENSIFGKLSDLTLVVKTKRGVAEYPSVSLSAVKREDRQKMADSLHDILSHLN